MEREITNFKSEMFDLYKRLSVDVRGGLEATNAQLEKKYAFQVNENQERVELLNQSIEAVSRKLQEVEVDLKRELAQGGKSKDDQSLIKQSIQNTCLDEIEKSFKKAQSLKENRKELEEKAIRNLKEFQKTWELKLANVYEQLNHKIGIVESSFQRLFEKNEETGKGFRMKGDKDEFYDKMDSELYEKSRQFSMEMETRLQEIREELKGKISRDEANERMGKGVYASRLFYTSVFG